MSQKPPAVPQKSPQNAPAPTSLGFVPRLAYIEPRGIRIEVASTYEHPPKSELFRRGFFLGLGIAIALALVYAVIYVFAIGPYS